MSQRARGGLIVLCIGLSVMPSGTPGQSPKPKKPTAEDVVKLWSPDVKSASQFGQTGGSPKQSPNVAAYSFRVVGPSFEEMWNHYARLCGVKQKYAAKAFLITADTGPNGHFVVSEMSDGKTGRGLSVFLLKTDAFTVTVTFRPDPDGQSISGSLSAIVPD